MKTKSEVLRKLSQIIIQLRRAGEKVTPQLLANHASNDEDLKDLVPALLAGAEE